jgi:hypothetical protein
MSKVEKWKSGKPRLSEQCQTRLNTVERERFRRSQNLGTKQKPHHKMERHHKIEINISIFARLSKKSVIFASLNSNLWQRKQKL